MHGPKPVVQPVAQRLDGVVVPVDRRFRNRVMLPRLVVPLTPNSRINAWHREFTAIRSPPFPGSRKNLRTPSIPPCNSTRSHRNPSPNPGAPPKTGHIARQSGHIPLETEHIRPKTGHIGPQN